MRRWRSCRRRAGQRANQRAAWGVRSVRPGCEHPLATAWCCRHLAAAGVRTAGALRIAGWCFARRVRGAARTACSGRSARVTWRAREARQCVAVERLERQVRQLRRRVQVDLRMRRCPIHACNHVMVPASLELACIIALGHCHMAPTNDLTRMHTVHAEGACACWTVGGCCEDAVQ